MPPILGLTHPTGYPLQVLLHKLWSVVPIGSAALRLNVLDAGFAAAAVSVVALVGHQLTGRWAVSIGGGLSLAFGELWWSQAVSGDKYTLNGLFLGAVLALFLRWVDRRDVASLRWLAFGYGLSLAHHRAMLLVAPALSIGLLLHGWRPVRGRPGVLLAAALTAPLLLYAYVPWAASRGLPPGSWPVDSPGAFIEYLLDRGYSSQIRPDEAFRGRLGEEGMALLRSFGPAGVIAGGIGAVTLFRARWRIATVLALAFIPQAVLGASYLLPSNYAIPRHWVFYLPAFLIWSLWVAVGLEACWRAARSRMPAWRFAYGLALAVGAVAVQAGTAWGRGAEYVVRAQFGSETLDGYRQDLQRSPLAERFGRLAFRRAERDAIIVCDWEQATVLWYLQRVEGHRRDIDIRYPIETLAENIDRSIRAGRPIYVARTLPDLRRLGLPSSDGPLLRVYPDGAAPPNPRPDTSPVRYAGGLTLLGGRVDAPDPGAADAVVATRVVAVTLFWQASERLEADYSTSVRLVDGGGAVVAQHDELHPALGASPTASWPVGGTVGDYHELAVSQRLPAGEYRVEVVPYRREPPLELSRVDQAGQPAYGRAIVAVIRLPAPWQRLLAAAFGRGG